MTNYYQAFKEIPPDPILGITARHRKDTNPNKINLSVGVYKSEEGQIAVLDCVHQAEKILWEEKNNKGYPPIDGIQNFKESILSLLVPPSENASFFVCQTVGSTAAIRLSGELLKIMGIENIYFSDLTWPNHPPVYEAAGVKPITYKYYNAPEHKLNFEEICNTLNNAKPNSAALFQLCCHNPTGRDPSMDEWKKLLQIVKDKNLFPVIDCAYQGFGKSIEEDILPLNLFKEMFDQFFLCYSCAKNFGVYGERVGAFIAFDKSKKNLELLGQNAKVTVRRNYSTPPIHGARIITTILKSKDLTELWREELKKMRLRIKNLRQLFLKSLESNQVKGNYQFVIEDEGLFSLLDISKEQVKTLRDQYSIYLLENGRINIAGLSQKNIEIVTKAFAKVL